jgi:hypothetical protein
MTRTNRARAACAALLCLLTAACFLLPGKFSSELALRQDGRFTFTYKGDIHVLALTKMAQKELGEEAKFEPQPCYSDETSEERACTKDELSDQRRSWEEEQQAAKAKKKADAEMMQKMLGGIDPADPRAAEELAARMRKQSGWRSVQYAGDGKFVVDFALSSRLEHDFTFPSIEKMPVATPFVALYRRADGTVRVEAPAFSSASTGGPLGGMAQGLTRDDPGADGIPELDGTFAIVSDGEILANNTDDGPQPVPQGKRLSWTINARSTNAPTALVRLAP